MVRRRASKERVTAPLALESLSSMIQAWRRHWDEVGAIQRSLVGPTKDRIERLSGDIESALAQTRYLFALEFPPAVVAELRGRFESAMTAIEALARDSAFAATTVTEPAVRRLESTQFAVNVRDVVAAGDALEIHLQPIVALDKPLGTPVGFEALARFQTTPYEPPNVWLERASHAGLQQELELTCVRGALRHLSAFPATPYLAVNVSPATLVSAEFERLVSEVPANRLVVEVTEHEVVREYDTLVNAIGGLRERGLRLAVDDAGAGFASFRHVLELKPDIIKLDINLTRGINEDRSRESLVRSLVSFAEDVGATLVAEGIESRADLLTLRNARVPFGQGYLFAHPGPAPTILRRRTSRAPRQRAVARSA
ncbi:MAG TPA: EAL domain-containing protein [Mycobacteriales bacterium]|nr:EAL domain-containing protein [Mycobacteriales bacterium]